jgi:hypothetical protein
LFSVVSEFREGGAVISAMFTGRKVHRDVPVDLELAGALVVDEVAALPEPVEAVRDPAADTSES